MSSSLTIVEEIEKKIARAEVERRLLKDGLRVSKQQLAEEQEALKDLFLIRDILNRLTRIVQESIKQRVERFVSKVIAAIYADRQIAFKLDFEERAGKMTARAYFVEDDQEVDPKDDAMGGLLDTASFALRIILFALQQEWQRPVIALDEPFKMIGGGEFVEAAAELVSRISHELGIQFIIVTHDEEFVRAADQAWEVSHKKGGGSHVQIMSGVHED